MASVLTVAAAGAQCHPWAGTPAARPAHRGPGREEAVTPGPVLARCARALKEATAAEQVYLYVSDGGIPHLQLAPHRAGDALHDQMLRGELDTRVTAWRRGRLLD